MGLTPISGEIQAQPLNDNFSYLDQRISNAVGANAKDYGAVGNGLNDDKTALLSFLQFCDENMVRGYIPAGTYVLNDVLSYTIKNGLDIIVDKNAVIKAGTGFPNNKMILILTDETTTKNKFFYWSGGTLDGSNIPESHPGEANDILYIVGGSRKLNHCVIENTVFTLKLDFSDSDTFNDISAGDSLLFVSDADNVTIRKNQFYFAKDSAVYLSANPLSGTISEMAIIEENYFYECKNAIINKRTHKKYIANKNRIIRCDVGIAQGEADTYEPGTEVIITENYTERCNRGIELRKQIGSIVANNFIKDIGYTADATYPNGILTRGSKDCIIEGNFIDATNGQASTHISSLVMSDYDGIVNENILVIGNIMKGARYGIETGSVGRLYAAQNIYNNCVTAISDTTQLSGDIITESVYEQYKNGINVVKIDQNGQFMFKNLPTSATGLPIGSVWVDTSAGNVLKLV